MDEEGNILYETIAEYGTKIEKLVPSFEGKTYTISDDILNATVKAEDMEFYGKLTINEYEVTIIVDKNKQDIVKLPYGSNVDEYILANYKPEEGYSMVYSPMNITVPANNSLVINVNYNPNIYILSYTTTGADNNNFKGEVNVAYGKTILDKLPNNEFEGYDFKGWFNEENKVDEDDTMPNGNLSVNGIYEIMSFIVIVKDGQTEVLNKEYTYGTKLQVVLDDIKEYRDNLYNEGYETNVNINAEDIIKSAMEFEIERTEREFELIFKNVEEIISASTVKVGSIIKYPDMSARTEHDVEYVFVWEDDSYNGEPMPARNLTIVGSYQEKAVAPIYYGSFKVARADYDSGNTSQYFNSEDVENPEIFGSILTADCITKGTFILKIPVDNDYSLSKKKLYWRPYVYLVPKNVANIFTLYDGIDNNITSTLVTDNKTIIYKGHEYIMFVYQTQATLIGNKVQELPQSIILK